VEKCPFTAIYTLNLKRFFVAFRFYLVLKVYKILVDGNLLSQKATFKGAFFEKICVIILSNVRHGSIKGSQHLKSVENGHQKATNFNLVSFAIQYIPITVQGVWQVFA
jgi:hypothetical protein